MTSFLSIDSRQGKVVTVSVETTKPVNELAEAVKQKDWLSESKVE